MPIVANFVSRGILSMVSVAVQSLNIRRFADLDKALWKAFVKAERDEPIPFFAWGRFRSTYSVLLNNKRVDWRNNYLAAFISGSVFAFLFVVGSPLGMPLPIMLGVLIAYCVSLLWMYWARATFIRKYSEFELKHTEIAEYAFGLDAVALLVRRVVEAVPLPTGKERKACLDALIKINKAAQDHGEVNFGFVEVLKKAAFTGVLSIFSAISWLLANGEKIKQASDGVVSSVSSPWIFYPLLGLVVFSVVFLLYDIVLGQPRLKKKKKRYLLVLNIIRETSSD
jgi:hypothetical protein